MKTIRYILLLLVILLITPADSVASQKKGIQKVIQKEFSVTPDARLKLNNRFGDITCTLWDKNEIQVTVTLSADTKSEDVAEKLFSKVEILFSGTETAVEVSTRLAKNFNSKGDFSIDYQVMMPSSVQLDLTNSFGDVMIPVLNAKSSIKVEYGKASLGKLNHGDNLIDISFGRASVESLKGAVVMIQFSKLRVDYAGSLRINSKYTDIDAGEIVVLDGTFEGGTVELDRASVLTLKTRFTSFHVGTVSQKIVLDAQFGNFQAAAVTPELKSIVVENQHGSVEVGIPAELSYTLDAESHFGSITFSKSNASLRETTTSGQDELYKGAVGSSPTAAIKIRNEFGSVKF